MGYTWNEISKLQKKVLARGSGVTREEFFAESDEDQMMYIRWLAAQARDIDRESRYEKRGF